MEVNSSAVKGGSEVKKEKCEETSSVQWQSISEVKWSEVKYSAKYMEVCHVTVELAILMYRECWDTFCVYYVQVLFTVCLLL